MRSKPYIRYVFLISLMIVVILILGYLSQDLSLLFTSLLASLKSSITITIIISVCVVLFMGSKILKSMKRYFNLSEKLIPGWETSLDEVIEKILFQHKIFGHGRFLIQLGIGTIPHAKMMRAIEMLGTKVAPVVRKEISG